MRAPTIIRIGDVDAAEAVRLAAAALRRGALAIIPTDTVYGLAAHPAADAAVRRLFEAKARDFGKPIALLAADSAAVAGRGAALEGAARRLAERFWPGALTLVLKTPDGFEGFRVPAHPLTLALLRACGGLLRATSANRSGAPPALTAAAALDALGGAAELVLDAGPAPGGTPSTVVRVDGERVQVLRAGAIAAAAVRAAAAGAS